MSCIRRIAKENNNSPFRHMGTPIPSHDITFTVIVLVCYSYNPYFDELNAVKSMKSPAFHSEITVKWVPKNPRVGSEKSSQIPIGCIPIWLDSNISLIQIEEKKM